MNKDEIHYKNNEITVIWKPKICMHSANCVNGLGPVFNPKAKPWVNMNAATTDEIIKTVNNCPSGALTYKWNDEVKQIKSESQNELQIKVSKGGPYLIKGRVVIIDKDGVETIKDGSIALCRCGQSSNKPYCDGSHKKVSLD